MLAAVTSFTNECEPLLLGAVNKVVEHQRTSRTTAQRHPCILATALCRSRCAQARQRRSCSSRTARK